MYNTEKIVHETEKSFTWSNKITQIQLNMIALAVKKAAFQSEVKEKFNPQKTLNCSMRSKNKTGLIIDRVITRVNNAELTVLRATIP